MSQFTTNTFYKQNDLLDGTSARNMYARQERALVGQLGKLRASHIMPIILRNPKS